MDAGVMLKVGVKGERGSYVEGGSEGGTWECNSV